MSTDPTHVSMEPRDSGNANLIYILYLVGFVTGITTLIGVVMAYMAKDDAPEWLVSHYHNQINIFWKALVYSIICGLLSIVIIGLLLLPVLIVWVIVRVVKGMQRLSRGELYPNPGSWGF